MVLLREILELTEITRSEAEGIAKPTDLDVLKSLIEKYKNDPSVFISYQKPRETDQMVLGVNVNAKYDTPFGVYGYPVSDASIQEQALTNTLPYAGDRPWIFFFRFKDMSKVWDLSKDNPIAVANKLQTLLWPKVDAIQVVRDKAKEIGRK